MGRPRAGTPLEWRPGVAAKLATETRQAGSGSVGLLLGRRRTVYGVVPISDLAPSRVDMWRETAARVPFEVLAWYVVKADSGGHADAAVVADHRRAFELQPVLVLVIDPETGASRAYRYARGRLDFLGSGALWGSTVAHREASSVAVVQVGAAIVTAGLLLGAGAHLLAG